MKRFLLSLLCLGTLSLHAQIDNFFLGNGHNGALTVNAANTVINTYVRVTAAVPVGQNFTTVTSTTGFAVGDVVMVLQTTNTALAPVSGTQTTIDISSDRVGTWELARVTSLTATRLTYSTPLRNAYQLTGVQAIKVPEYSTVTINAAGSVIASQWNGTTGGIVAFLATGNVTLAGQISATGKGFRGGVAIDDPSGNTGCTGLDVSTGAQKGEGISNTRFGSSFRGRGNIGNAGGGGVCLKAGGGGGGHCGLGGIGGRTEASDGSRAVGGLGGAALTYSALDRLNLGGGGGAGHAVEDIGIDGGVGGGIVFIRCASMSGAGSVTANGAAPESAATDAGSGAGAGGCIYLRATGAIGSNTISAAGGIGGNTDMPLMGPGGGGGGGKILVQANGYAGTPNVSGGAAGTQPNAAALDGLSYGAAAGAAGCTTIFNTAMATPATPVLLTPANGASTYAPVTVTGTGDALNTAEIFVDNVYNGSATMDAAGYFTYTINSIAAGSRAIKVAAKLNGINSAAFSNINTVTINASYTWSGGTGAWATSTNWTPNGVPGANNPVTIATGAPTVTGNVNCYSITVNGTGSLTIPAGATLSISNNITSAGLINAELGTINMAGTAAQNIPAGAFTNNLVANLTINNAAGVTLGGALNVSGTLTATAGTLTTGGFLTLMSSAVGTARVAPVTGAISGNVTVERYIPSKAARKWSFVTAPVTGATLRSAWQQQVFVTGAGTGGALPCAGITTGNGGTTDRYNTNGFDVSTNNAPTVYSYNGAAASGSRWTAMPNISTALVAGKGYRMNIRGVRGASDANCTDQLNTPTPPAPAAATLSATGTLSTGDVPVTLDGIAGDYTLLGNPYASSIDFDLFNAGNTSLAGKYWFYSPENTAAGISNTAYSAYTTGSMTNKPTGYTDANSKNIASGQSFFVQKAGVASVTFKEAHKSTAQTGSFRTQSYDWSNAIRAGLKNADGSIRIDEVLVRFGNMAGVSKNYTDEWDARSINEGAPVIVSLKGTERLAIQTRPLNFQEDVVKLGVTINTVGNYQLAFSEYEGFAAAQTITLKDRFLNVEQDIRTNAVYPFSVTADANSKGDGRFEIVLKGSAALPVNYMGITAKNKGINEVEVNWQLPNETDVKQYGIERSADSRNFEQRGTVNSRGNSTVPQSYTFTDAPRLSGTSYYRVKATDKSGAVNYSPVVKVSNGKEQMTVAIYPNPVKDKLNMVLQQVDGNYTIRISTMEGKTLLERNGSTLAGNIVTINTASLPAGVYMVETRDSKGNKSIEKIVKQ